MPRTALLLTFLFLLAACRPAETPSPEDTLSGLTALQSGWNLLEPGGETICSNGTPFAFYVRPGNPEKLLLYFQGGGACWFGEICDLEMTPSYDPVVDENDHPAMNAGIFDYANPENPFTSYSTVFVPYCTADVHVGNRVTTYPVAATDSTDAHEVTIHHKGHTNVKAVLDWTFANIKAPTTVFIAGSSAGAFPSAFYLPHVAEQYPEAHLAQLADGAGGYRGMDYPAVNNAWGTMSVLPDFPEFEGLSPENALLEDYLIASARRYPNRTLTQYNTAGDDVQLQFLALGGITDTPLIDLIEANYADIRGAVDNFRAFTAGGTAHTILTRPEFYTYQADGVRFLDWVVKLANNEPVEDVMCSDCETAALFESDAVSEE